MKEISEWPGYDEEFWETLLDGRMWELKRGEDFKPRAVDFKRTVKENAERRGKAIRTTRQGDHTLCVQAIGSEGDTSG